MFDPYRVRYRRNYYPRKGQVIRPKLLGKKPNTIRPELIDDYREYFINNKILQDSNTPVLRTFNFTFDPEKNLYMNLWDGSVNLFGINSFLAGGNYPALSLSFTFNNHNLFYNEYYTDEEGDHMTIHGVLYRVVTSPGSTTDPKQYEYTNQYMESSIIFYNSQDNMGIVDSTNVILNMEQAPGSNYYGLEGIIKPNYVSQTNVMYTNATPENAKGELIVAPLTAYTTDILKEPGDLQLGSLQYLSSKYNMLANTWLEHYPIILNTTLTSQQEYEPEYIINSIEVDWDLPLPSVYATCSILTTVDPPDDYPGEE